MENIEKKLEYINNPDFYVDTYNADKDKIIQIPLVDYLDNTAIQNGFDSYKDMLERGFSIDYSISFKDFYHKDYPNLYEMCYTDELIALYNACNKDKEVFNEWENEAKAYKEGKIISSNFYRALCKGSLLEYTKEYANFYNQDKIETDNEIDLD